MKLHQSRMSLPPTLLAKEVHLVPTKSWKPGRRSQLDSKKNLLLLGGFPSPESKTKGV
jgi:hypothetical protein